MTNSIWDTVTIDPSLREFIVLSPKDVHDLTMTAIKAPNPVARLSELLNERGRAKRDRIEGFNQERMAYDRTFLTDHTRWPGSSCCVKEQPWVKANGRRYGVIYLDDFQRNRWIVHPDGETPEVFTSLEELVKVWSVD
jgi:hypothetical protein